MSDRCNVETSRDERFKLDSVRGTRLTQRNVQMESVRDGFFGTRRFFLLTQMQLTVGVSIYCYRSTFSVLNFSNISVCVQAGCWCDIRYLKAPENMVTIALFLHIYTGNVISANKYLP